MTMAKIPPIRLVDVLVEEILWQFPEALQRHAHDAAW